MSAAGLHEAAVGYLTGELSERRFFLYDVLRSDPADDARRIEVLLAIGALDAGEAAEWRARFERAAGEGTAFGNQVRERARDHLRALEAAGDDGLSGAIAAFRGVGLIGRGEEVPRGERRREEPYAIGETLRVGGAHAGDDRFVRFLPGPDERVAGLRVTVVELYESGVVVDWHYSAGPGADPAAEALWKRLDGDEDDWDVDAPRGVGLADDVGTAYRATSGGWSGRGDDAIRVRTGHSGFTPGVPDRATHLDLRLAGEATLRVDLSRQTPT